MSTDDSLEVDQYGPVDLLYHSLLSSDHVHSDEELLWHCVLIHADHRQMTGPIQTQLPPISTTDVFENIRGVTLNQLLLVFFNLNGQENNPETVDTSERINIPGGKEPWIEASERILVTMPGICPMESILVRVVCLFNKLLSGKSPSVTLQDTTVGAVHFLTRWVVDCHEFMHSSQLLDLRAFSLTIIRRIESLKDGELRGMELFPLLVPYLKGKLQDLESTCLRLYQTSKNSSSCDPALPINLSLEILRAKGKMAEDAENEPPVQESSTLRQPQQKIELFGVSLDMDDDSFSKSTEETVSELGILETSEESEDKSKALIPHPALKYFTSYLPDDFEFLESPKALYEDFFVLNVAEIARQWTLQDQKMFSAIKLSQFMKKGWTEPRYLAKSIEIRRFIDRFNAVSSWVTQTVLLADETTSEKIKASKSTKNPNLSLRGGDTYGREPSPGEPFDRALMYGWMVELAICFDALNNFSGVMAVITGLQQSCVMRMKETMQLVPASVKASMSKLQKLMAFNKNYQTYRAELISRMEMMKEEPEGSVDFAVRKAKEEYLRVNAGSILESWGVFIGDESNLIDARGVCGIVPHLGAHLAELCAIDEGNTDYVIDFPSLINLGKLLLLGRTLIFLRQLQQFSYDQPRSVLSELYPNRENAHYIIPIRRLATVIGMVLQPHVQLGGTAKVARIAQEFYDLSIRIEPDRSALSPPEKSYHQQQQMGLNISPGSPVTSPKSLATSTYVASPFAGSGGGGTVKKTAAITSSNPNSASKSSTKNQPISSPGSKIQSPPRCTDGVRRYNADGEETSSMGSSDTGGSGGKGKSGGFMKIFSFMSPAPKK